MKRFAVLLTIICGQAFGQSGIYNVPYKPQPRIIIPHVEAPAVLVDTNGTVAANPYRDLKYCDFVLKCIDQSGVWFEGAPLRYLYSSAQIVSHVSFDLSANVFYQNLSLGWPNNVLRKKTEGFTVIDYDITLTVVTNHEYEAWATAINNDYYPTNVVYDAVWMDFQGFYNGMPHYYGEIYFSDGSLWSWASYKYSTNGQWIAERKANQPVYHEQFVLPARPQTSTNIMSTTINVYTNRVPVATNHNHSIIIESVNSASAIEVYPTLTPELRQRMMFSSDKLKWMCLLSNGIDFYRDPQSGEPMWFNVVVEWVDRVPEEGVFNN